MRLDISDPNYDAASDPNNGWGKPMPPATPDTTGKVVTLPKGIVVTDIGSAGIYLRKVKTDDGREYEIISRVIHELPVTHRRKDFPNG